MNKKLEKKLQLVKQASLEIAKLSAKKRALILLAIAKELEKHKGEILYANKKDVTQMKNTGATHAFLERLVLSEDGFTGMVQQLKTIAEMKDVLGEVIEQRKLNNGIKLKKLRFPIGVIFVIYESRPAITIDIASLCIRSGNAVILKGGSESTYTNNALYQCANTSLQTFGIKNAVTLLTTMTHEQTKELLARNDFIDLVIPRGNYALTEAVAQYSKIPILYHCAGGARAYIDKSANVKMAIELVVNAKVQRNSVCNALDCIVIHKDIAKYLLRTLAERFNEKGVEIRADREARKYISAKKALEKDFSTEFLDAIIAIKIVDSTQEAMDFITQHSHHHTEMLIANDKTVINTFIQEIDAAGLMINCSSRLNDGGEFGMGAEIGIATGKFHARGPVGAKEMTTYKWIAYGSGQIRENI